MRACVTFRLPAGEHALLSPGDLIGRIWSAALHLDDPGVSEAHALVSLRGEQLKLLALRGRFSVDGQVLSELELAPGQQIRLSRETVLQVVSVQLPESVIAVEGDGLPRQSLTGTCSLSLRPHPRLLPGDHPDADARFWISGEGWRLRVGAITQPLLPGEVQVGGWTLRVVMVDLALTAHDRTRHDAAVDAPLRIVAHFDTGHLLREGQPPVVLSGHSARILSEVIAMGGSAPWEVVARELFPGSGDRDGLRRRWDVCMLRLRNRLKEAGIRGDLVRSSRGGQVELLLQSGDVVEDRG